MRILGCIFSALLLCAAFSSAQAQTRFDKLDAFGAKLFGTAKPAEYAKELEAAAEKIGNPQTLAAAARTAALYVFLARIAQTKEEIEVVNALRESFDKSAGTVIRAVATMASVLESATIGKELEYVYGQARKIISDPAAAAEFFAAESEAMSSLGVSPARLMALFREQEMFRQEELRQLKETADQLIKKIQELKVQDVAERSGALLDIFIGGGTAIVDIPLLRTSTTAGVVSVAGGLKQAHDGWKKLTQ